MDSDSWHRLPGCKLSAASEIPNSLCDGPCRTLQCRLAETADPNQSGSTRPEPRPLPGSFPMFVASPPNLVPYPLARNTSLLHVLRLALHRCITGRHPGTSVKHSALQTRVTKLNRNLLSSFLPPSLPLSLPVRVCVAFLFCSWQTRNANHRAHRAIQCSIKP